MTFRPDDIAADRLAAGVLEDYDDCTDCKHCGASVMPWQLECQGCGKPAGSEPEPQRWTCTACGHDEHESRDDAELCCSEFLAACEHPVDGDECQADVILHDLRDLRICDEHRHLYEWRWNTERGTAELWRTDTEQLAGA